MLELEGPGADALHCLPMPIFMVYLVITMAAMRQCMFKPGQFLNANILWVAGFVP